MSHVLNRYRSGAAIMGTALAVPLLCVLAPSAEAASTSYGPATAVDSTRITGAVLTQGVVRDLTGAPASGARVALYALPIDAPGSPLRKGLKVTVRPVAFARTDAFGRYALRVPSTVDLSAMTSAGNVNFMVRVNTTDGAAYERDFTQKYSRAASGALSWGPPAAELRGATSAQRSAAQLITTNFSKATAALLPSAPQIGGPPPCTVQRVADYGGKTTTIGGYFSRTSFVSTSSFKMATNNTSTLGVGVSATGGALTFTASGTKSVTSAAAAALAAPPTGAQAQNFRSTYFYAKYAYGCATTTSYKAEPYSWGGNISMTTAGIPAASFCADTAPITLTRNTGNNKTFATGVSIKAAIGVDLSSKVGWSTAIAQTWKITGNTRLCGSEGGAGSTSPGYIVIG